MSDPKSQLTALADLWEARPTPDSEGMTAEEYAAGLTERQGATVSVFQVRKMLKAGMDAGRVKRGSRIVVSLAGHRVPTPVYRIVGAK